MFRHVVMFRWIDEATEEQRRAVPERLSGLPGLIPEIGSYSLGTDAGVNPDAHDFVVVAEFADANAYAVYRDHPEHRRAIAEVITPIVRERAAIQYEL